MPITILGAGILSPNHITLEADAALRKSSIIFYLLDLNPRLKRYLKSLGPRLVDLDPVYQEGAFDEDVYQEIARIVTDAHRKHRHVSLLVPGHPQIYVSSTSLILERAKMLGLTVAVLPGISSLDTMILQLQLEIGAKGIQVFECNRLVYYQFDPDPRVPLFLLQPGGVGTGFITHKTRNRPRRFQVLVDALTRTYPPNHPVYLLVSECVPGKPALKKSIRLADLPKHARLIDYDTSLFIPPAREFSVQAPGFYEKLFDPDNANSLLVEKRVQVGGRGA